MLENIGWEEAQDRHEQAGKPGRKFSPAILRTLISFTIFGGMLFLVLRRRVKRRETSCNRYITRIHTHSVVKEATAFPFSRRACVVGACAGCWTVKSSYRTSCTCMVSARREYTGR